MSQFFTSALPYEHQIHEVLHAALSQRFWSFYESLMNESFRLSKQPVGIQIDDIQDLRLKMKRYSRVFTVAYESARVFTVQVLEEIAMHPDELLLPIAQIDDTFMIQSIGLLVPDHRQKYMLVTFLDDYETPMQKAQQELLRVFMKHESSFSAKKLAYFANVFLHQGFTTYNDFFHQDLHHYLLQTANVLTYLDYCLPHDATKTLQERLEQKFELLFNQIDRKKINDWFNGEYFYDDYGNVKRHYLQGYVYANQHFVIRFDDFSNAYLYLRIPKSFIQTSANMMSISSDTNGLEVAGDFEEEIAMQAKKEYGERLRKLGLAYPKTVFEQKRYKQLVEELI